MNPEEAKELGYEVIAASPIEVGLLCRGEGLRTWWASRFGGKIPSLDHPDIMDAIEIHERCRDIKFRKTEDDEFNADTAGDIRAHEQMDEEMLEHFRKDGE
jgi:hypothetical protein